MATDRIDRAIFLHRHRVRVRGSRGVSCKCGWAPPIGLRGKPAADAVLEHLRSFLPQSVRPS